MRKINVIKAFNLSLPGPDGKEGRVLKFDVGEHEVGTYERPIWTHEEPDYNAKNHVDQPTGRFETCEIADHPWVTRHCGPPLTREERLARIEKLKRDMAELEAQAEKDAPPEEVKTFIAASERLDEFGTFAGAAPPEPMKLGVTPNARQGYGA